MSETYTAFKSDLEDLLQVTIKLYTTHDCGYMFDENITFEEIKKRDHYHGYCCGLENIFIVSSDLSKNEDNINKWFNIIKRNGTRKASCSKHIWNIPRITKIYDSYHKKNLIKYFPKVLHNIIINYLY